MQAHRSEAQAQLLSFHRLRYAEDLTRLGRIIMKKVSLLAIFMSLWPGPGLPQSTDDLLNDGKNTDNVTTQSMGYDRKSYSPLKQINKSNVKRLVPVWSASLMNDMGELAAPVIYK